MPMGISRSIRRRLAIGQGEKPMDRIRIFFSGKSTRRRLEHQKFPLEAAYRKFENSERRHRKNHSLNILDILDTDWYSKTHSIPKSEAVNHFLTIGIESCFAPNTALSRGDCSKLSHWAAEFLTRLGFKVGANGKEALRAGDPIGLDPFRLSSCKNQKIAVVTAIFGDHDRLLPVDPRWTNEADFFVFSDRKYFDLGAWKLVHANFHHVDPRMKARFVKTHLPTYFADYEKVIWIDGNVLLLSNPSKIISALSPKHADFASYRHWQRQSLVAEGAACAVMDKEDIRIICETLNNSFERPSIRDVGLLWTVAIILNPKAATVRNLCDAWWRLISQGSKRDQLSLPAALSETKGLKWGFFVEDNIETSKFFLRISHK